MTTEQIAADLAQVKRSLARIEKYFDELIVKRPSLDEQAKMAGVSRTTIWRRRQRLELERIANGSVR